MMIAAAAATGALALPAVAEAHVDVQPSEAASGASVREDLRVPNEQDKANTTKLAVQLPDGFADASYEPVPGWSVKIKKTKLAKPVKNDEGQVITEQVTQITWSGGKIAPGQFQDFPLSVQIPGKAGTTLTFKAIQTYDNGDVVRWIGSPDSEEPAPQVKVTAAESDNGTPAVSVSGGNGDDSNTLAIAALIVGGLGLVAGGAALATRRRA
jgi:uncharacterized protein YcnI